jgi:hypothetical protein
MDKGIFMEEEDVVKDVLRQKINSNKQKTSHSQDHKIMAKDGQTNQKFNATIVKSWSPYI